jgi:hypothetical protein
MHCDPPLLRHIQTDYQCCICSALRFTTLRLSACSPNPLAILSTPPHVRTCGAFTATAIMDALALQCFIYVALHYTYPQAHHPMAILPIPAHGIPVLHSPLLPALLHLAGLPV